MTDPSLFELRQKYLNDRLEFFIEPYRFHLRVFDVKGERERYIEYETITTQTRMFIQQDGRLFIAAISFGVFSLVGFVLNILDTSTLMRWTPLWGIASIIFFGFYFYMRRRYFLVDLTDGTSIFFLADNPSKVELERFVQSLLETRKKYMQGERGKERILNIALSMCLEFGEHMGKPIQSRLAAVFPDLSSNELDEYNTVCESVKNLGYDRIYSLQNKKDSNVPEIILKEEWKTEMLKSHPWINEDNLQSMYSQGMYYAMH